MKDAIKFFGSIPTCVVLSYLCLDAQDLTYQQRIADLDAKASALEKRLEESESRSLRYKTFIEQAQARLDALRSGRKPVEPVGPFPPLPTPEPQAEPKDKEPLDLPVKPRESKGYYMQAFGGFLMPGTVEMKTTTGEEVPIESHNGVSGGIVFGRDFGRFRLESEISGRKYNHDTMDLSLVSLSSKEPVSGYTSAVGGLVTALVDIALSEDFVLFLGVGTGVNGTTVKLEESSFKDTLFAYHLLTGFAWDFTERASIRFLYKYFTTAGSKDYNRLDSHNLELGLQVDL